MLKIDVKDSGGYSSYAQVDEGQVESLLALRTSPLGWLLEQIYIKSISLVAIDEMTVRQYN